MNNINYNILIQTNKFMHANDAITAREGSPPQ